MRFFLVISLAAFLSWVLVSEAALAQAPHPRRARVVKPPNTITLFEVRPEGADALLSEGEEVTRLKKVEDFANVFYKNCLRANKDPALEQYAQSQCACAAAEMPGAMTLNDARKLFGLTHGGNKSIPYTRFIMLAHLPCLEDTMGDIVIDECLTNQKFSKLRYKRAVCNCVSRDIEKFIAERGTFLVPGITNEGFNIGKGVDDLLDYALNYKGFQQKANNNVEVCIKTQEFGW